MSQSSSTSVTTPTKLFRQFGRCDKKKDAFVVVLVRCKPAVKNGKCCSGSIRLGGVLRDGQPEHVDDIENEHLP